LTDEGKPRPLILEALPEFWYASGLSKKPKGGQLSDDQQDYNKAYNARAIAERGNSLLKTTFKALRNISLCPWTIGIIVAAALVILHIEHDRTT